MTYYVEAHLNGRVQFLHLAEWCDQHCLSDDVYYDGGSWHDNIVGTVLPHLKFHNEEDALLYVLAFGGRVSTTIPIRQDKEII